MGANNPGQVYAFNVTIQKGSRFSVPTTALLTITQQDDYSSCISLSDYVGFTPLSYSFGDTNRTIFLNQNLST